MDIKEILTQETIKNICEDLGDLLSRLQSDYAGDIKFEQTEEDRLAVGNAYDILMHLVDTME